MDSHKLALLLRSALFRQCLTIVLETKHQWRLVEACAAHADFIDQIRKCDVAIIDLDLPNVSAIELIHEILAEIEEIKVVVFVPANTQEIVAEAVAAGAHACVQEESSLDELVTAIERVLNGEAYCSRNIMRSLFGQFANLTHRTPLREDLGEALLTAREQEILSLVSNHLSNKQIAKRLCVSVYTVKNHVHNILEKLNVDSRFRAVEYARSRHWFSYR